MIKKVKKENIWARDKYGFAVPEKIDPKLVSGDGSSAYAPKTKTVPKIKKYILVPGRVLARDGQEHNIGAETLSRLYKVELWQCIVWDPNTSPYSKEHMLREYPDLKWLEVQADGIYAERVHLDVFKNLGSE